MERYKQKDKFTSRSNFPEGFLPTPEIITSPYPFLAIGDLEEVIGRLIPNKKNKLVSTNFQFELLEIQKKHAPKSSTFYFVDQKTLISKTETLINSKYEHESRTEGNVGIINFDKYLLLKSNYDKILRLNLSRGPNGLLVSRPGSNIDKNTQLEMMSNWLLSGNYDSIILTDDVVAFADTFGQMIGCIRNILPEVKISVVSGICSSQGEWRGKEKLNNLGVDVSSVILSVASPPVKEGSSGMAIPDSRDFTIFGGKVEVLPNGRSLSFPYFYPFSKPLKSFYENGEEYNGSSELFELNQRLVGKIEDTRGKNLTIGDLENSGFGIPYTSIIEVRQKFDIPDSSVLVSDYLSRAKCLI